VLIWDNRQPRVVAIQGQDQLLNDVNTAGVAVGTSFLGDLTAAWVYRDSAVTRLRGGVAEANGINDSGVIVGAVDEQPARWRSSGDQPEKLALPGPGWTGYAAGVDEDGTIVGRLSNGSAEIGYLWSPDGSGRQLPVPQLRGKPATVYTADAIRNGWVQGWVALDEGPTRYTGAVRWNLRTGEVDSDTFQGHAESVNRHGWMVGSIYPQGPGFIADGTVVELPRPAGITPSTGQGRTGTIPYTISDDGRTLAGQVDLAEIQPAAVVWSCR
jgi:hypothetical protein